MIQSYFKENGQPIVSFRGDRDELKDDLVRIIYTMVNGTEPKYIDALQEALNEVRTVINGDVKMITEALDEH